MSDDDDDDDVADVVTVVDLSLYSLCCEGLVEPTVESKPTATAVQALLDQGANANTQGRADEAVLVGAVRFGYHEAVKTLLAVEDIELWTYDTYAEESQAKAFWVACFYGDFEIAKVLLEAHKKCDPNVDINDFGPSDETALCVACTEGHVRVVEFLLSIPGIDIYAKNKRGKVALTCVDSENGDEIRALLAAFATRIESIKLRFLVLWCMSVVDKKFRKREAGSYNTIIDCNRYSAANGVDRMQCYQIQAHFLEDELSPEARLFYLAFTFVDGTDGISNGIARHILSYVGLTESEGVEKRKRNSEEKIELLEKELDTLLLRNLYGERFVVDRLEDEIQKAQDDLSSRLFL
jgi:hypothetical protein